MNTTWTHAEILAIQRTRRLASADVIALLETSENFEEAIQRLGVIDLSGIELAQAELEDLPKHSATALSVFEPNYPDTLRELAHPPPLIYYRGSLDFCAARTVAIVGTRRCTNQYGKPVTELLVKSWVVAGVAIVSGLANGIDTLAHEACVKNGGLTVAVIASGFGRITPQHAQKLSDKIVENNGCILSEYPPRIAALPPYFPARNRIISAISEAVVVVESHAKGGALITAEFALKQSKPIYAVPGPIISDKSTGTNRLIAKGLAICLAHPNDLLIDLQITQVRDLHSKDRVRLALWPEDADTYTVDELAERWKITVPEAYAKLLLLEFDGSIRQLPGKRFEAVGS